MEEITPDTFLNGLNKGCLPLIFKEPVLLEPPYSGKSLGLYNRETRDMVFLRIYPSPLDEVNSETSELFLNSLRGLTEPVSFEIIGNRSRVISQTVLQKRDRNIVRHAFDSTYAHGYLEESYDPLFCHYRTLCDRGSSKETLEFQFNDYYPLSPFYFPLLTPSNKHFIGDPLGSLCSVFSSLEPEEFGFYQVVFIPAKSDWARLARELVGYRVQDTRLQMVKDYTDYSEWLGDYTHKLEERPDGREYHPYLSESELTFHKVKAIEKTKDRKPFFAVILRIGLFTRKGKSHGILKTLRSAINTITPGDRPFQFLSREHYEWAGVPEKLLYYMFFNRVSLRPGMLLTSPELSALVHLPTQETIKKGYPVETAKGRRPAPAFLTSTEQEGIVLGETSYRGKKENVLLTHKERVHHCHIIGTQGSGKSTLIANCVLQDIAQHTGACIIDPHGDLIDRQIVPKIPSHLLEKVIYFDPLYSPLALNILEARHEEERTVIADDVVSIFKRLSDNWGVQMDEILSFGVSAILSSGEGGHLGTLYRFLTDDGFRQNYLKSVEDEFVVETWKNRFPKLPETAIAPVLRRLTRFLRDPVLRKIVSNKISSIDFRQVMDEGKVLLVKLPLGKIGADNASMLGGLIISRLHAAALTREDIPEEKRRPFYLFADEFQNFICKSVEESIYGTRKFNLGLVLAHHTLQQLWSRDKDVAEAVLAARTRICFQVGDEDASHLAKGFLDYTPQDLQNLGAGEAIVRVGGSVNSFEIKTHYEPPLPIEVTEKRREELTRLTREKYGIETRNEPEEKIIDTVVPFKRDVVKVQEASEKLEVNSENREERTDGIREEARDKNRVISEYRKHEVQQENITLTSDEKRFLEFLAKTTELLPVRDIYKRVGLSAKKGNKIKTDLLERRFIVETEIRLEKAYRKSKIPTLTTVGYQALHLPLLSGKGGSLHQHLQKLIAECARDRGYEATIEEQASNGKLVDVGLTNGDQRTAVEISVTTRPNQVLENITLDLEGGYHRVIVVCIDTETMAETKKITREKLDEDTARKIGFCLVGEFEEEL
jgi:hypothetical protein